jgi:NTE family protein
MFCMQPNEAPAPSSRPTTALLLTGGGARAAYQVGVLEAIASIRRECGAQAQPNPFPIIVGTSAGAINAAALACGADDFDSSVSLIATTWRNFHAHEVYRADHLSMLRSGATWLTLLSLGWILAKFRRVKPKSLLDNAPLGQLLQRLVPLERLPDLVRQGHLQALAVSASSYSTGDHVTFFEGDKRLMPWVRTQRYAVRDRITRERTASQHRERTHQRGGHGQRSGAQHDHARAGILQRQQPEEFGHLSLPPVRAQVLTMRRPSGPGGHHRSAAATGR